MSRALKADFYRVNILNDVNFQDVLLHVDSLSSDKKNLRDTASPLRMQELHINRHTIEGDMIRIRMDQIPVKASLSGGTEFINLEDDEGIGEELAFLYHVPFKVLILQKNRHALSASAFAWYFNCKGELNHTLSLHPVLRSDVLQRLADMTIVRKFDVKIAGIDNSAIFSDQGHGVNKIIALRDEFTSPSISISLSMGKHRGSLSVNTVKESIRNLFSLSGRNDRHVKKLEVLAQADYGSIPEPLDILKARIIEQVAIDLDGDRRLPYEKRRDASREALVRRHIELGRMFSANT